MKIRSATTHLGGAIATYLIVASCSQQGSVAELGHAPDGSLSSMGGSSGTSMDGSPGDQPGGHTLRDAQVASRDAQMSNPHMPSRDAQMDLPDARGLLDASSGSLDASSLLDAFISPVHDASAQSCGTCEVPTTLEIKTADTDMARSLGGQVVSASVGSYAATAFIDGPAIVMNMNIVSSTFNRATTFHLIAQGATCNNTLPDSEGFVHLETGESYNGRIVVPANFSLCAVATAATGPQGIRFNWSGFRPY